MQKHVDLNCDLGEWKSKDGAKLDEAIMPFISSCNVACGGHIGDEESMRATIRLAQKHGVALGAHPGYPDPENFGRVVMDITPDLLKDSIIGQINRLKKCLEEVGVELHHVKPHGALYNQAVKDKATSEIVISAIKQASPGIKVYLPEGSFSSIMAKEEGLEVIYEVFADRAYEDDLRLRSRALPDAVLHNETDVITQLRHLILEGKVLTYSGVKKPIKAETICLHSDTPGAITLAQTINTFLRKHGVAISIS
ncbi:MAG: 5-oxoprolinase subunit PxpA [Balneolaceae bacterium]|nr:5-oxoprolinase subunit PxpA [Balneolaceae bacterium]MBO6546865.1 5-oxoprolinase subunit PxpA [Balneolaceae bacterium]MBO6649225.1 5-oxoprolinase subunit PxpA [Balneolaceae bacterium]